MESPHLQIYPRNQYQKPPPSGYHGNRACLPKSVAIAQEDPASGTPVTEDLQIEIEKSVSSGQLSVKLARLVFDYHHRREDCYRVDRLLKNYPKTLEGLRAYSKELVHYLMNATNGVIDGDKALLLRVKHWIPTTADAHFSKSTFLKSFEYVGLVRAVETKQYGSRYELGNLGKMMAAEQLNQQEI